MASKVYFTSQITPQQVLKLFELSGKALPGNVAIDQACVDLIYASKDRGRDHMVERIESRHGLVTLAASEALGTGTREYELINID